MIFAVFRVFAHGIAPVLKIMHENIRVRVSKTSEPTSTSQSNGGYLTSTCIAENAFRAVFDCKSDHHLTFQRTVLAMPAEQSYDNL